MPKLPNCLRRIVLPNPYRKIACLTAPPKPQPVAQPAPRTFKVRSMLIYQNPNNQLDTYFDKTQQALDGFVPKWAKFKLGVDLQIEGNSVLYNETPSITIDPNNRYGIAPIYQACEENYGSYDLWLVYAPFYTPRTRDLWAGFYDWGKMVFNTYVDNFTHKDETYIISEELLHALLDKMGYNYQTSVEKVHNNRSASMADFFDKDGNFLTSGNTRDTVPNSYFITVGGSYL